LAALPVAAPEEFPEAPPDVAPEVPLGEGDGELCAKTFAQKHQRAAAHKMPAILTLKFALKQRLNGLLCGKLKILFCIIICSRLECEVVDLILTEANCRDLI
jgi:hypothetical protein